MKAKELWMHHLNKLGGGGVANGSAVRKTPVFPHLLRRYLWTLMGNFVIELIVYGIPVVLYSVLALRLLGEPLAQLFGNHLIAFASTGLALVVAQAVLPDFVTSFLLDRLYLERME